LCLAPSLDFPDSSACKLGPYESLEEAMGAGGACAGADISVCVGLLLNSEFAYVKIDKGPAADDKAAAKAFREFWGDRSELRR